LSSVLKDLHLYDAILIGFAVYLILLVVIGLIRERKLKKRFKIKFKNFVKFNKFFDLQINKVYIGLSILFLVGSTIFSFILIENPQYSFYTLLIGLGDVLLFLFMLLHISSVKYNKDLSIFHRNYEVIHGNFTNKKLLEDEINRLNLICKTLIDEYMSLNKQFSQYVQPFDGIDHLNETLFPLNEVIKIFHEQVSNFDHGYIPKFDELLNEYLKFDNRVNFKIDRFIFVDLVTKNKLMDLVEEKRKECIYLFAYNKLKDRQIVSSDQLVKMLAHLKSLEIQLISEFIIEVLSFATVDPAHQMKILQFLSDNQLMMQDVLCDYVHKLDLSWVYELKFSNWVTPKDGLTFFQSLGAHNAQNCTYKILTSFDNEYISYIKQFDEDEQIKNETQNMLNVFYKIFSLDTQFSSESTKYENMALVLFYYFEDYAPNSKEAREIREIVSKQVFEERSDYIESIYSEIIEKHKALFLRTINTLFIYSSSNSIKLDYINYKKVMRQYTNYKKNLNFKELMILDVLLKALILVNEQDVKKINKVYQLMEPMLAVYKGQFTSADLTYQKRDKIGKESIRFLTSFENKSALKRVLSSVENGRLILDKFLSL